MSEFKEADKLGEEKAAVLTKLKEKSYSSLRR